MTLAVQCDFCEVAGDYDDVIGDHAHPELDIGGVPVSIWTPHYSLVQRTNLDVSSRSVGITRFNKYIPFEIFAELSLGEGSTSLSRLENICSIPDVKIFLKDETTNPSKSFKDRGMLVLISDAVRLGKKKIAIPSTGNAAISLGLYGKKAGIETLVFIPGATSSAKKKAIEAYSTPVYDEDLIQSYEHCMSFCRTHNTVYNGFPASNIPYTQGLKTMAYEIFLQLGGKVPDWIIMPCGSGGNIVGQYYGFRDLLVMGLADRMPKFVSVQVEGADPITQGYTRRQFDRIVVLENPVISRAEAIASDTCFNYFKIMSALQETCGIAVSVTEDDIYKTYELSGLLPMEFSSMAVYAGLEKVIPHLKARDVVVLVGTASEKS